MNTEGKFSPMGEPINPFTRQPIVPITPLGGFKTAPPAPPIPTLFELLGEIWLSYEQIRNQYEVASKTRYKSTIDRARITQ